MDYGKETISLFEIDQPLCSLSYGNGACPAVLGVDSVRKCFNTRATCPVPASYLPTVQVPVPAIKAAMFGGTTYLQRLANLTGIANAKSGIVSAWVHINGGDGQEQDFLIGSDPPTFSGVGMSFYRESTNQIIVQDNTGVATSFGLFSGNLHLEGEGWLHILAAWDGATGAKHLYINDLNELDPASVANNVNTNYASCTQWAVAAFAGSTSFLDGCLAELFFAPGQFLDLSITANRRKFIDAAGAAVNLGTTGSTPTGTAPRVFLHLDRADLPSQLAVNRGTGGDFTVGGGVLLECDDTPPAYTTNISVPLVQSLRFAFQQDGLLAYGPLIPSMQTLDTTPAALNLAAMDKAMGALGTRESVSVTFDDHLHSDDLVDPYRLERINGVAQKVIDAYLSLPGVAGNFASTPDSVAASITGDIDIRAKLSLADWTPGSATAVSIVDKCDSISGYRFIMNSLDLLRLDVFVGGSLRIPSSTAATGFVDGSTHWVRVTRASASGNTNFYTSEDGVTWTQLGAANVASTAGAITDNALTLQVGGRALLDTVNGVIYYADVRGVISGATPVAQFDPNMAATDALSFTSKTGEVWTINRSGGTPARLVNPDGYDPYLRGTFWGKWIARNPYHSNYLCRVYEGFMGDAVADMRVRHYIIDTIAGPTDGQVTIVAKDLFSQIEEEKAVAPRASNGRLSADITSVAASATLAPAGIGNAEYPASGNVNIGGECITFTRAADVLTLTVRGALNTVAAAHKQEDLVQLVLSYSAQLAVNIVYDLLLNYGYLTAAQLPKADWDFNAVALSTLYTGRITTPTPVKDLIGELSEQGGFTVWPDVGANQIQLTALRAAAPVATIDQDGWIVDGSLALTLNSEQRVSQVWVYYAQIDPTKDLSERTNFRSRVINADLTAEDDTEYGTPKIKEIFSRWIPQFGRGVAVDAGLRSLSMYRDPPFSASFACDVSRDADLHLSSFYTLAVDDIQDDTGTTLPVSIALVEVERGENDIKVAARQVRFFAADTVSGDRIIYIENDSSNLNLRTVHDTLFAAPNGTETVRFIVTDGVTVGSMATSQYAIDTGDWPSGVLLFLNNPGRIEGRGGDAGAGGTSFGGGTVPGGAGNAGGPALRARYPITVDNTGGEIWAGGGGGGGGGAIYDPGGQRVGGGGGGGGVGASPGAAAAGGAATGGGLLRPGNPGTSGTTDTAGIGGAGGFVSGAYHGGAGGNGGGPGLAGSAGSAADISGGTAGVTVASSPGAAGAAGNYITGNAFVTWASTGDRRGGVA